MTLNPAPLLFGHSFDGTTGMYLLPVRLFLDEDGNCPLPDYTVDFPPTDKAGANQAWRINADRTAWEVVADYRGVMIWSKATAGAMPNRLSLGEHPPQAVTVQAPLAIAQGQPATNRWNSALDSWELVPDYSQTTIWDKATGASLPALAMGVPLPATATDQAPPRDAAGPWQYSDVQARWDAVTLPELVKPQPHPPEFTTDVAAD